MTLSMVYKNNSINSTCLDEQVIQFITELSNDYPNIESWLGQKVFPGIITGSRKVTVIYREHRIAAVGIAKNENGEKKICTVRVSNFYSGYGMGIRIFNELMEWLETDKPHLTVSENKLPMFQRIFDHFGFTCTSTHKGRYREGAVEYFFNE